MISGVLLHPHPDLAQEAAAAVPDPALARRAAAAVIIPLVILEDVVPTEDTTGPHFPPPLAAGLHLVAAGPAHIPAATDTPPVADAATTVGTGRDTPVALLLGGTGHTLALIAARPLWIAEDSTSHDQDPPATAAGTDTTELTSINVSFPDPLPDHSEAGQDPGLQNAPLLL